MRIAIGGIAHETNTFSTLSTEYADFRRTEGAALVDGSGWEAIRRKGVEIIPLFSAHATPSGRVSRRAHERLLGELLSGLRDARPLDGVLLTLHGAMEVEGVGDGETAIIEAVRAELGEDLFLTVTLDLHANLAPEVVGESQIVTAYRTAPHRDGEGTRLRGMRLTVDCLERGLRPVTRMVKLPLLVGGEAAVTEVEPAKALYARLPEVDQRPGILVSSILIGCAWTDSVHTRVAVVVSGTDEAVAGDAAEELAASIWTRRDAFAIDSVTADIEGSIRTALDAAGRPVFISDSGDNTTAGAAGDSPLFLQCLAENAIPGALVAGITDPEAVCVCERAGVGSTVRVSIGGKLDAVHAEPFACGGVVQRVASGNTLGEGRGSRILLRTGEVDVVLQSDRRPFTQLRHFREMGLAPDAYKLIVVKEGYLFPELRDYAPLHIMGLSPGFGDQRLERLPFIHLHRPIHPLDPDVRWEPWSGRRAATARRGAP